VLDELREVFLPQDNFLSYLRRAEMVISDFHANHFHILGGAGSGKTHAVCGVCESRAAKELPTLLLLGKHFRKGDNIESRIRATCDIPMNYSWLDFLSSLNACADACGTRALIVLEGINEAEDAQLWRDQLPGFIASCAQFPRIVVVTTCRASYRNAIWPLADDSQFMFTYGFSDHSLEEAVSKYFDYYKLHADLTFAAIEQFAHPLYLRIFLREPKSRTRSREGSLCRRTNAVHRIQEFPSAGKR